MVTAPAVVSPDSHTLPLNSAGAVLNTSKSQASTSFHTVYDSLPTDQNQAQPVASADSSSSKEPRTKKESPRHSDSSLTVATGQQVVADVPPPFQWTPAVSTQSDASHDPAPTQGTTAASLGQPQDVSDPTRTLSDAAATPRAIGRLIAQPLSGAPVRPDNSPDIAAAALPSSAALQSSNAALGTAALSLPETIAAVPLSSTALTAANAGVPDASAAVPAVSQALPAVSEAVPDNVAPPPAAAKNSGKQSSAAAGTTAARGQLTPARSLNPKAPAAAPTSALIAPPRGGDAQAAQDNGSPDSRPHAGIPFRAIATGSAAQPAIDSVIHKGLADAIVPRSENLAFSLRMREADSLTHSTPAASAPAAPASRPAPARTQPVTQTKDNERASESQPDADAIRAQSHTNMAGDYSSSTAHLVWSEAAAAPRVDTPAANQAPAPPESANITAVAAMHEAHPVLPETPKAPTAGEIVLQLGGKDQPAAIRISERAGNVNVAVHAADPDLRSSLRSNLGELASQLTHQGWKTDVVKSTAAPRSGDSPQDSHQDGQRSPGQQQAFTQGDRHQQRDRRANGGQWLAEFEEQASGNTGGKN